MVMYIVYPHRNFLDSCNLFKNCISNSDVTLQDTGEILQYMITTNRESRAYLKYIFLNENV